MGLFDAFEAVARGTASAEVQAAMDHVMAGVAEELENWSDEAY